MAERLDLIKDVFNKAEYIKTIDTSFSELNNQSQIDIPTFFREYNRLFFDIPKSRNYRLATHQ